MQELMTYGRPQAVEKDTGSIFEVLAETERACRVLARTGNVTLEVDVPPDLPSLPMDRRGLERVFENLLENAIQSSRPGDTVRVTARVAEQEGKRSIECRVEDEGPGFSEQDLPRVFEPFFTRRRGGTGLGLAVAQRIIEDHRGSIAAFNRRGGGAVMSVRFPIDVRAEGRAQEREAVVAEASHSADR
jgi:signal transduction histidine kinase